VNWGYIIIAYLSLFALGISDNIRGPLFPDILKSFAVTDTHGAYFFALSSLLGFFGSYGVRFLLPKLNRVPTLQLALLLMGAGLIGMGLSQNFYWLLISTAIFGFSIGVVGVVQNVLVTVGALPSQRQRMLSGLHAFYGLSSLLAPLTVAGISALGGSWHHIFLVVSVIPLALMVGAFKNKKEEPLSKLKFHADVTPHGAWAQIYLGFALGSYVMTETMISTRLSLFVRRELHADLSVSSYYLTGFFVCMLIGRLIFAARSFHWTLRRMLSGSLLLSAVFIALGLTFNPVFLVLSGLSMAPFYPLAVAYVYHHFADRIDSAISSCMAIQALLTVIMHAVVGYLTEIYGISVALWAGPVILIFAFLILNSFETVFRKRV
jgi:FHS family glucose/mannose:H+ symporter-like MFS transporter